jgi:glutamine amidotransferase
MPRGASPRKATLTDTAMCELLAMSSRLPTHVNLALRELARHGGETGPHKDGWGIAYAMGRDFRIIKEPEAAAGSDCVRYIEAHRFTSRIVISHIRKASLPKALSFENTHPFDRELFGRRFVFAHNGHLPGIGALAAELLGDAPARFLPLGETDSEAAFCLILNRLAAETTADPGAAGAGQGAEAYDPHRLWAILRDLSPHLLALGRANFLLADGEWLFAHGDNSLHSLTRTCPVEANTFQSETLRVRLEHATPQVASLVATVPLTDNEAWRPFARGELRVFHDGAQVEAPPAQRSTQRPARAAARRTAKRPTAEASGPPRGAPPRRRRQPAAR